MKIGIATTVDGPPTVDAADHLRVLLECSNDAIIASSLEGLVNGWNPAAERLFGYSSAAMTGRPLGLLCAADRQDEVELILDVIRGGQRVEKFQTERLHSCGKAIPVSLTVAPIHGSDGTPIGTSTIVRDLTHEQHAQTKLWEEQFLDGLTRLPNRRLFNDKLHVALGREDLESAPLALLMLNIDRFQEVNEALGDTYGDHLLIQAGSRIQACSQAAGAPPGVVMARLSGDEFALLLPGLDGGPRLQEAVACVLDHLRQPFRIAEHEVTVSARAGFAVAPRDGITPEELRMHAEMALREARRLGGDRWQAFTEELRRAASRRARLQAELRQALELQQFELHYQPILSLRDGSLCRCEALLRWCHPELGMVPPAEFIPLAEESGLIRQIGHWVFCTALAQAVSWRRHLRADIQIAVNLSPVQLAMAHSREIDEWAQLVRASGLPRGA
ncbi:MAG: diguanylate cyclase, partial [Pseudomonadota bacterium]|nr:diguanylate cyclase [Pseudomonadota bacterium]